MSWRPEDEGSQDQTVRQAGIMKKQPQYKILSGLTILLLVAAALTVLPYPGAFKVNVLGYKSLCAFAPLSTLILLGAAGFVRIFRDTQYRTTKSSDE